MPFTVDQNVRCPHCGKPGLSLYGFKPGDQFIINCTECHATVSGGIGRQGPSPVERNLAGEQ